MKRITVLVVLICCAVFQLSADALLDRAQSVADLDGGRSFLETLGTPETENERLAAGIARHMMIPFLPAAEDETKDFIDETIELLDSVSGNPLATAYKGSARTMLGGWYSNNRKMMRAAKELFTGIAEIDQAVEDAPEMVDLRILRLFNSLDISGSSPANRDREIDEDLEVLDQLLPENDADLRCLYAYAEGASLEMNGRMRGAVRSYRKAVELSPNNPYGIQAAARISALED